MAHLNRLVQIHRRLILQLLDSHYELLQLCVNLFFHDILPNSEVSQNMEGVSPLLAPIIPRGEENSSILDGLKYCLGVLAGPIDEIITYISI